MYFSKVCLRTSNLNCSFYPTFIQVVNQSDKVSRKTSEKTVFKLFGMITCYVKL